MSHLSTKFYYSQERKLIFTKELGTCFLDSWCITNINLLRDKQQFYNNLLTGLIAMLFSPQRVVQCNFISNVFKISIIDRQSLNWKRAMNAIYLTECLFYSSHDDTQFRSMDYWRQHGPLNRKEIDKNRKRNQNHVKPTITVIVWIKTCFPPSTQSIEQKVDETFHVFQRMANKASLIMNKQ